MILFTMISHVVGSIWQRDADLQPHRGPGQPVAVVADPRRRGARSPAPGSCCSGASPRTCRRRACWPRRLADAEVGQRQVHLRPAGQPGPAQPEPALPPARHHQPARGVRAATPTRWPSCSRLDHLATRVRRNAESLLVLSGEQPPRDLGRAGAAARRAARGDRRDRGPGARGVRRRRAAGGRRAHRHRPDAPDRRAHRERRAVLAAGNRRSRSGPARPAASPGGQLLTVEDWGVGMPPPSWPRPTSCWPTRPRSTCRSRSGSASTSWPGWRPGTASGCR